MASDGGVEIMKSPAWIRRAKGAGAGSAGGGGVEHRPTRRAMQGACGAAWVSCGLAAASSIKRTLGSSTNLEAGNLAADMSDIDVLIIGAGHNGLTCAAYLAMNGMRVKVVERRKVVGGAAVTEEFHPGFRNSVAAYTV